MLSFSSRKPTRGKIVGPSHGMRNIGRVDPLAEGGTHNLGPHSHHSPGYFIAIMLVLNPRFMQIPLLLPRLKEVALLFPCMVLYQR